MTVSSFYILLAFLSFLSFTGSTNVRLVYGTTSNPSEGRVEVYHNGEWGTVCDDGWDTDDASVICGMVGYSINGAKIKSKSWYGQGTGPIWLSSLGCSGSETDIANCSHAGWGTHTCSHREDAGAICKTYANDVRLVGGPSNYEGRVEVKNGGVWGTICGTNFGAADATVICNQMVVPSGKVVVNYNAYYGEGTGTSYSVSCSGGESSISECGLTASACAHSLDVGIQCIYTHYDDAPLWLIIVLLVVAGLLGLAIAVWLVKTLHAYCQELAEERKIEKARLAKRAKSMA